MKDYGINFENNSAIVIKNGTIQRFGLAGIYNISFTTVDNTATNFAHPLHAL